MITRPFLPHAFSPLHAGTGHAADVVDLPTARHKATGIPFVPGSSIKGVLRDARRTVDRHKTEGVFGPSDDPAAHAGALVVGDARLLALPVRSFRGTFAWTTSPLLLTLAKRDLEDDSLSIPHITGPRAVVATGSCVLTPTSCTSRISICPQPSPTKRPPGRGDIFTRRFAVVDHDTMTFLWETATQVDARVRLDEKTHTVAPGALCGSRRACRRRVCSSASPPRIGAGAPVSP
jgi:CRISPR-associated protein Cmr4